MALGREVAVRIIYALIIVFKKNEKCYYNKLL